MILTTTNLVDKETGELLSQEIKTIKKVKADEFIQVYLNDMSGMMNITSKSELRVLLYFWKYSTYVTDNQPGNMVSINSVMMKNISEEMDINIQSIRNIISSLKKKSLIIADKNGRGVYYLNPTYFFKGALSDRAKCYTRTIEYQIEE